MRALVLTISIALQGQPTATVEADLTPPILGLTDRDLRDSFDEVRGKSRHEAIDIMKPVGTPVLAVVNGTILKLFLSKPGGITIYLVDEQQRYCYYYAHLDRYRQGLREGLRVSQGEILGFVGSSGNAHPAAPHLHMAIFELGPKKEWWKGTALNPYPALLRAIRAR